MKIIHSSSLQNTSLWKYWPPSLFSSSQYLWVCLLFGFAHGLKSFVQWIFPWLQAPRLVLICIRVSYNIDVVLFQKSEHLPHCRLQEATLAGAGRLQPWCDTPMLSLPPCCPLCTHKQCLLKRTQIIPQAISAAVCVGKVYFNSLSALEGEREASSGHLREEWAFSLIAPFWKAAVWGTVSEPPRPAPPGASGSRNLRGERC